MKRIEEPYQVVVETLRRVPDSRIEISSFIEGFDSQGRRQVEVRYERAGGKRSGGILLILILIVTVIGIVLWLFMPRKKEAAGHVLVVDNGDHTLIAGTMLDDAVTVMLQNHFAMLEI